VVAGVCHDFAVCRLGPSGRLPRLPARREPTVLSFLVAVFFVLLISCSNVANLMLARGTTRERELAVRTALGAGRGRLSRQVLTESILIAMISGIAGVVLASLGLHYLIALAPASIPRIDEAGLNGGVLVFAAAISLLSALTFGSAPVWKLSSADPSEFLRTAGTTSGAHSGARTRSTLVVIIRARFRASCRHRTLGQEFLRSGPG
jgi:predicted lysophospholipase L1 biosynthesis ABC-type transport system permease subunit